MGTFSDVDLTEYIANGMNKELDSFGQERLTTTCVFIKTSVFSSHDQSNGNSKMF